MAAPSNPLNFCVMPAEGIDFSATYTPYDQTAAVSSTNTPSELGPMFPLGMHALGSNNSEYVFCKAGAALTQYSVVAIDSAFSATVMTVAKMQALQSQVGFCQVTVASGAYFWCAIRGYNLGALLKLSSLPAKPLYISSLCAGRLTSTSVRSLSGGTVFNVVATTCGTTSPSGVVVIDATWPGLSRAGG